MLLGLTGAQMQEWEHFYQIEPWGSEVEELRFGNICSVLANLQRSSSSQPFKASDFLITYVKPRPEYQSTDELMASIEGAFCG